MLGAAGAGVAIGAPAAPAHAPGYYDFRLSSRTFASPLFETRTSGSLRFFSSQTIPGAGDFKAWVSAGFPEQTPFFGISGEGIAAGPFSLNFNVGDFDLGTPQPEGRRLRLTDRYALRGVGVQLQRGPLVWGVFAGRSRNTLTLPGIEESRSTLWGGHVHTSYKRNFMGGGVTVIDDAVFADPARTDTRATVVSGRFVRPVRPRLWLYSELFATAEFDLGARVGAAHAFRTGEIAASLYTFGDEFPIVYPLYRPGEQGVEFRGRMRPTEFTQFSGNIRYLLDDEIRGRRELRGSVAFDMQFGSNRPSVSLMYSHDDVVDQLLMATQVSTIADRVAMYVNHASSYGFMTGSLEHVFQSGDTGLDRTQGLFTYRRSVGIRTVLDGSAVVQRDEASNFGLTAESAVERPIRGRYYWLAGLGASYVDRQGPAGEGVARVGGSRRIGSTGWFARLEFRIPFSIGLERSYLNRQNVALDVGNRFNWSDFAELREALPGKSGPRGIVEGTVMFEGAGLAGIQVLVDGQPRAVTDGAGQFRVRGVKSGTHRVALDMRTLDPGLELGEHSSHEVEVKPKEPAQVAFALERFSSLQGAIVVCEAGKRKGLASVEVILRGGELARSARTSHLGGFHFTRVPPGVYELSVVRMEPAELLVAAPIRVDLGRDIFGFVIELGCD